MTNFVYNVNLSNGIGDSLVGTITTDGTFGRLQPSNIVDWNLVVTETNGLPSGDPVPSTFDLTGPLSGGNSTFSSYGWFYPGGTLFADSTNLTFNFQNFFYGLVYFTAPSGLANAIAGVVFQDAFFDAAIGEWAQPFAATRIPIPTGDIIGVHKVTPPPTANPYFTHDLFGQQDSVAAPGVLASVTPGTSGDTLTVSAVNGSAANVGLSVAGHYGSLQLFGDGHFIYTPTSALPASGVAEDIFSYTALEGGTSGGGSASSTLTVIVAAPGLTSISAPAGQTVQGPNGHSPVLDGTAGNNTLLAGNGATVLIGGPNDTLTGGKGADTFVFMGQFGANTITNYNPNKDIIQLDHNEFKDLNAVTQAALPTTSGTVITDHAGDSVTLVGVNLNQLHFDASHFLLA
jgi:hypothetical protein